MYLNDDDTADDAEEEREEVGDSVSIDKGNGAVVLQEHGEKDGGHGKHEDTHTSIGHISTIQHGRYLCTELKQFTTTHISEEREMSKWRVKEALPRQQCKSSVQNSTS